MDQKPIKRAAAIQSSYIPWRGFFDIMNCVDHFVFYDDVQFSKGSWRNRNRINSANGPQWLTIPVLHKGRSHHRVCDIRVADQRWAEKHWRAIELNYAKAPFFNEIKPELQSLYRRAGEMSFLSEINRLFIEEICDWVDIDTEMTDVREYDLPEGRVDRLVELCRKLGADEYISGPSAQAYIDPEYFSQRGVDVKWMSYDGYPDYPSIHGQPPDVGLSFLDVLLNVGPDDAKSYMLSFDSAYVEAGRAGGTSEGWA